MPEILSEKDVYQNLRAIGRQVRDLTDFRRETMRQASVMRKANIIEGEIKREMDARLAAWDSLRDDVVTALGDLYADKWLIEIKPGERAGFPHWVVNPNDSDLGGVGTIRIAASHEQYRQPFYDGLSSQLIVSGDMVRISNADDPNMNGVYEVDVGPSVAQENIIVNGSFDSTANWTETSSNVSITGGQAVFTAASGSGDVLNQARSDLRVIWPDTTVWLLTITLADISGGQLSVGTNTVGAQAVFSENGTYSALITADANAEGLKFTPASFTGNINSVSLIRFTGLTFTTPFYDTASLSTNDANLTIEVVER